MIIRADSGYGSFENIQLLKATGVKFVVKGFSTQQSKNLAKSVQKHQWQKINIQVHVAEIPTSTALNLITLMKNIAFDTSKLKDMGVHSLIKKTRDNSCLLKKQ
ncbi:hypothetical protein [Anaerovirgula multivorans]|uniref:hypothetical protein n=1 Tax=Anaerovirgula multivorans TaxID=312168 RepID=UPI000B793E7A|nr:hypothetical protein [Anaerovirgula multivorans]